MTSTKKDFAPGLPSKKEYGDLSALKPGQFVDWLVQLHQADKAGRHYDVRFGLPDTGLFSWATKKELPKPGERIALFQQPLHRHGYKDFEGEIEEGYGKGKVTKHEEGRLLITKITPNAVHFTKATQRYPERFVLAKPASPESTQWLLLNVTPTEPIPYNKVRYTKIPASRAEQVLADLKPGSSVSAKLDGAASLTKLTKNKFDIASYRVSKETGRPIIHTERVTGNAALALPKELHNTILRGELYGIKNDKAIPPQELGGLLNSAVERSLTSQQERGITLKNMIFDVQQVGGKSTKDLPYAVRQKLIQNILPHLPSDIFHGSSSVSTPESALALYKQISKGEHPLTREGVVIHPAEGKPAKIKLLEEHDAYITGVFPGEGKYKDSAAGGFTYSLTPGGKTVGKVGAGLSDDLRKDMWNNPEAYVGRVARVRAQEKLPSGALRAPALLALHEDYPIKKRAKTATQLAYFIGSRILLQRYVKCK